MRKILIISCLCLASCAGPFSYGVDEIELGSEEKVISQMHGNFLAGTPFWSSRYFAINLEKMPQDEDEDKYSFIIEYRGPEWLFINAGEKLRIFVNDEELKFSGSGSMGHREALSATSIVERAWFETDMETIERIAEGGSVKVWIIGKRYYYERHFNKSNFVNFRHFVKKFMRG